MTPPLTFPVQTPFAGNRPIAGPFGSSPFPGVGAGIPTNVPGISPAPVPLNLYGPNVYGPNGPGGLSFGPPPAAMFVGEAAGITAPALLTAVALRRGQPQGPTNDQEVEDFLYDALELLPGASDVEVRCEAGRATLTGSVQHKRLKRDIGEIAWAIPALNDVQNNVTIASRRRARGAGRESEPAPSGAGRKQG